MKNLLNLKTVFEVIYLFVVLDNNQNYDGAKRWKIFRQKTISQNVHMFAVVLCNIGSL